MIQKFGGRKFLQNCSHQKLADNILANDKIAKVPKILIMCHLFTSQLETQGTLVVFG